MTILAFGRVTPLSRDIGWLPGASTMITQLSRQPPITNTATTTTTPTTTAPTTTFIFPLAQFTDAGRALLNFVQRHPTQFAICSLVIAAGLATIIVPHAIGFGAAGIIIGEMLPPCLTVRCVADMHAGTPAAAWQAAIGNVVAGSLLATLQAMTTSGVLMGVGGGLIAVGVVGLVERVDWARGVQWAKSVDWSKGAQWEGWAQAARLDGQVRQQWGGTVEWAKSEGWKSVASVGKEGLKRVEEGVRSVDWKGAVSAGQEGLKRVDGVAKRIDWQRAGKAVGRRVSKL